MVENVAPADILSRIEKFCAEFDMAPTKFGRLAVGDANLVKDLQGDRSPTLKTVARIATFMASYSPDNPPPFPNRLRGTDQTAPGKIAA